MLIIKKSRIIKIAVTLAILFLSFTSLYIFKIGNTSFSYFLALGFILIGIVTAIEFKIVLPKNEIIVLLLFYIAFSSFLNFNSFKLTSVLYSYLFLFFYVYIVHCSKKYLSKDNFIWILKCILITFFSVLVISQFIVLLDMQHLERPKDFFQSTGQLGIQYNHVKNFYRFHSLSTEPSYSGLIILIAFAVLNDLVNSKKKLLLYFLMVIYMIISFKSSIGYIALIIFLLGQAKFSKKYFFIFLFFLLIGLYLFFFTNLGGQSIGRVRKLIFLFFSFKGDFIYNLNLIDSSANARIGPLVAYIKDWNLLDYHSYFGYGASSSEQYFSKIVYPESWNSHLVFRPPFFPGFLYDYGIFGVLLVGCFLWKQIRNSKIFYKLILLIALLNSNFNTQLFWYIIMLLTLNEFFLKKMVFLSKFNKL